MKYQAKYPDKNHHIPWNRTEDQMWSTLYKRQVEIIQGRACDEFFEGLERINFTTDKVPQPSDVNQILKQTTGWSVTPVEAIIPAQEFFELLASKSFPAACFIRTPEEIDYIQEPDIFHEFFGHCPLLTNQLYADFMEEFGKMALSTPKNLRSRLFRLFWFTIEFGLMKTKKGNRIYGGGILSSPNETAYALDSDIPIVKDLDIMSVLRSPYRIDIIQPLYYLIEKFDDLFDLISDDTISALVESKELGDLPANFPPKEL